ncbi:hypothetical protein OAK75_02850 [Bacteriovoracales bacterium]|nr:hypothetical protein [Bacteriovoracales bacterium]
MIRYLILFLFFSTSTFAKEGHLAPYWFVDSDEKSFREDNLDSIDSFLKDYVESHESLGLNNEKAFDNSSWKFSGFQTSLALGLSGKLGIYSWGGTKVLEVDWTRKEQQKALEENVISFNESTTEESIDSQVKFIVGTMVDSGKVKNENLLSQGLKKTMKDFHILGESLSQMSFSGWRPNKLRLEMGIKATGKIVFGPVVKVGGDVRLRLEWKSTGLKKRVTKTSNKELKTFFEDMGDILFSSLPRYEKKGLSLSRVEIGLGLSAKGKIAIAELGGYGVPSVFFKKSENYNKIVKSEGLKGDILIMSEGQEKSFGKNRMFKVKKRKVRKGLKKAFKFSYKFMEKFGSKVSSRSQWKIKKIKSQFKFSLGGSLGPVKIKGTPHLALYFN